MTFGEICGYLVKFGDRISEIQKSEWQHWLWRDVARKLKLGCYTPTNYELREIAAVEFTLKMSFQKLKSEMSLFIVLLMEFSMRKSLFCSTMLTSRQILVIRFGSMYDEFSLDPLSSDECLADFRVEKDDIPRLAEASHSFLIH